MQFKFKLVCDVEVDGVPSDRTTALELVVNAEDLDNAMKKGSRALQQACMDADVRIFYTHDR